MKKISILFLSILMIFSFIACDNNTPAPEKTKPTSEEIVIDYIDSINFKNVMNDVMASVKGEESAIKVAFDFEAIEMGKSEAIPFSISIVDGKVYDTGFHEGNKKEVKAGAANVVVYGTFTDNTTFEATSYTMASVKDAVVSDAKFGEHKLSGLVSGAVKATIKLTAKEGSNMTFELVDGYEYSLPEPGENVSINLDGKAVDYVEVYAACNPHTGNKPVSK